MRTTYEYESVCRQASPARRPDAPPPQDAIPKSASNPSGRRATFKPPPGSKLIRLKVTFWGNLCGYGQPERLRVLPADLRHRIGTHRISVAFAPKLASTTRLRLRYVMCQDLVDCQLEVMLQ